MYTLYHHTITRRPGHDAITRVLVSGRGRDSVPIITTEEDYRRLEGTGEV